MYLEFIGWSLSAKNMLNDRIEFDTLSFNLYIIMFAGSGVCTKECLKKGELICYYNGRLLSGKEGMTVLDSQ